VLHLGSQVKVKKLMASSSTSKLSNKKVPKSIDPRFSSIRSDPRFRPHSIKRSAPVIDERLAPPFEDDGKIDKRGKKVKKRSGATSEGAVQFQ
jgi:hypothetical protein